MDTHHCPRCELRFANTSELRQHFAVDHGGDSGTFERYRYRAGPSARFEPSQTVLVVGNRTLEQDEVLDSIADRAGDGTRVIVLVPATHEPDARHPEGSSAIAQWRLAHAVERLRAAGVDAEGLVGDADPFTAVVHLLRRRHVDEIVVSTLPKTTSRWLGVDLPGRLHRHTGRVVHTLTPLAARDG